MNLSDLAITLVVRPAIEVIGSKIKAWTAKRIIRTALNSEIEDNSSLAQAARSRIENHGCELTSPPFSIRAYEDAKPLARYFGPEERQDIEWFYRTIRSASGKTGFGVPYRLSLIEDAVSNLRHRRFERGIGMHTTKLLWREYSLTLPE